MPNKVDIKVEANADVSDLDKAQRELRELEQGADAASKKGLSLGEAFSASALGNLGADIIANASGKLVQMGSDVIHLADQLVDLSGKAGTTVEGLQRVGNAAADNGSSMTEVADVLAKLNLNAAKAELGNKDLAESFNSLGLKIGELKTLSSDEMFLRIADAVKNSNDAGKTYADVARVMGEQSKNLFATLQLGKKDIEDLSAAFGVMSDATAQDLDRALQEIDKFKKKSTIAFGEILAKSREFWNALTDNDALTAGFEGMLGLTREQQNEFRKMSKLGKKDAEEIVQGIDGIEKKTKQLIDTTNQYKLPDVPKTETSPTNTPEQKAPIAPKPLGQNTAEIDAALGQKTAEIDASLGKATEAIDSGLGKVVESTGVLGETISGGLEGVAGEMAALNQSVPDKFKPLETAITDMGESITSGVESVSAAVQTKLGELMRRMAVAESQIANLR